MKRIAAHYLYINPCIQLKNAALEIEDCGTINRHFFLNEENVETYNTEFYTGFIAPAFVSPKIPKEEISNDFIYINDFEIKTLPTLGIYQEFIFDFENKDLREISQILWHLQQLIPQATIFDFINWCSYFPEKLINKEPGIKKGKKTEIYLFEDINLLEKKFTERTKIRKV
jgi:hypothetical protein